MHVCFKTSQRGTSTVQWLGLCTGSIPGWGTKAHNPCDPVQNQNLSQENV